MTTQQQTNKPPRTGLSRVNPGGPKLNPSNMPYGTGSIQKRSAQLWMIYRDSEGNTIQENCWTLDRDEARRKLAAKSIETLEARLAALRTILDASPTKDQDQAQTPEARGGGAGNKRSRTQRTNPNPVVPTGGVRTGRSRS